METEPFFNWIDDLGLKKELTQRVLYAKSKRKDSQKNESLILQMPLTKFKQVENGTSVDFNAINNYLNYYGEGFLY